MLRGLAKAASVRALGAHGFWALVGLFTLSGAAGLLDQVCFSKYLSYVVGATAYAVGAVVGGRMSSRIARPLVAYGVAEVLVGISVALAPLAFAALTPMYVSLA